VSSHPVVVQRGRGRNAFVPDRRGFPLHIGVPDDGDRRDDRHASPGPDHAGGTEEREGWKGEGGEARFHGWLQEEKATRASLRLSRIDSKVPIEV
jgi:hypothetical protein